MTEDSKPAAASAAQPQIADTSLAPKPAKENILFNWIVIVLGLAGLGVLGTLLTEAM